MKLKTGNLHGNRFKLLIVTVGALIIIAGLICSVQFGIRRNLKNSLPVIHVNAALTGNNGLNASEIRVLSFISGWDELPGYLSVNAVSTYNIYYNCMEEYFSHKEVELSTDKADRIAELILGRNKIVYLEKEYDINKMSFDGRSIAIYILKQIYEISGLKLVINMKGEIEQIKDSSGNIMYEKNSGPENSVIHIEVLIITLLFIFTSFVICIAIAKKKRLFIKGGKQDGFDEKEFA